MVYTQVDLRFSFLPIEILNRDPKKVKKEKSGQIPSNNHIRMIVIPLSAISSLKTKCRHIFIDVKSFQRNLASRFLRKLRDCYVPVVEIVCKRSRSLKFPKQKKVGPISSWKKGVVIIWFFLLGFFSCSGASRGMVSSLRPRLSQPPSPFFTLSQAPSPRSAPAFQLLALVRSRNKEAVHFFIFLFSKAGYILKERREKGC